MGVDLIYFPGRCNEQHYEQAVVSGMMHHSCLVPDQFLGRRLKRDPSARSCRHCANVALKVSSGDPDYKDMSPDKAKNDFLRRIQEYEKVYETITEPDISYLRIMNVGKQVTVNRINGSGLPLETYHPNCSSAPVPQIDLEVVDELDAGVCDGMTYEQAYPDDFANRDEDKFNYRYRGMLPVFCSLSPPHRLSSYRQFCAVSTRISTTFPKKTFRILRFHYTRYPLPIAAVDTHRPKPKAVQQPTVKVSTAREYYTPS
ncbi:bifunctional phosphofructo-2-kinase/fructose-2,6-bisphosphate [Salix suchowensis]|nr:bifunctional phosphofructo-2-kinase/fructose-2,6-bisphosphate [Salix suchowensis]